MVFSRLSICLIEVTKTLDDLIPLADPKQEFDYKHFIIYVMNLIATYNDNQPGTAHG
jgi:hypothetical protein